MATTITGNFPNTTERVALNATAANCTQVTLPEWVRSCAITFVQTDGATADTGDLTFAGTDGAAIGDDTMPIGSGGIYSFSIRPVGRAVDGLISIYVTAGTNSAYCHVHCYGAE